MTTQNAGAPAGPAACSMTFWNRDFLFGISGFFCLYMAVSLFFYLPVFLKPFTVRQSQIGLIMGIFSIVAIAVRPLFGRMIDVRGGRSLAVAGIAVLAAGIPFFHLVHDAGWLPLLLRAVMGAGWGVSMSATIALCSDLAPADRLARSMGIIGVAGLVANALGPLAAEEISRRWGFGRVFDVSLLVSAMPVFHGAIRGVIIYFIAVFGKSIGLERVGSFFLVFSLAAILTRFGTGDLSDRFGRKTIILPAALVICANLFLISRIRTTPLLIGTAFLGGIGQGLIYPALSTYIIDFMGRANKGLAISMYNSLFDVGMGIGSPFFGWIADLTGYRRMYVFAGLFLLAATAVFMARAPVTENQTLGEVPYVSG
jgi:MFS family permease